MAVDLLMAALQSCNWAFLNSPCAFSTVCEFLKCFSFGRQINKNVHEWGGTLCADAHY